MRADTPRVSADWLALRGPADEAARSAGAGGLAGVLAGFLRTVGAHPARLVDVGAGTGAGAVWLRARLPAVQEWRLVDLDADLLALAQPVVEGWAEPVVADLADLADELAGRPAEAVTCQALLDLLRPAEVHAVLDPARAAGAAVLAGLTVTGGVRITPAHPDDHLVVSAFNAHQRRGGRLGPDAGPFTAEALRRHGYTVTTAATPWRLGPQDGELIDGWLAGRAQAAIEQLPSERRRVERWLADRRASARDGRLTAMIDHVDLLALPPGSGRHSRPGDGRRAVPAVEGAAVPAVEGAAVPATAGNRDSPQR